MAARQPFPLDLNNEILSPIKNSLVARRWRTVPLMTGWSLFTRYHLKVRLSLPPKLRGRPMVVPEKTLSKVIKLKLSARF